MNAPLHTFNISATFIAWHSTLTTVYPRVMRRHTYPRSAGGHRRTLGWLVALVATVGCANEVANDGGADDDGVTINDDAEATGAETTGGDALDPPYDATVIGTVNQTAEYIEFVSCEDSGRYLFHAEGNTFTQPNCAGPYLRIEGRVHDCGACGHLASWNEWIEIERIWNCASCDASQCTVCENP